MTEEPQGKRGRSQRLGARKHTGGTSFDDAEWALFERASKKVGRGEEYSFSHRVRLAALDWARQVLGEEEK